MDLRRTVLVAFLGFGLVAAGTTVGGVTPGETATDEAPLHPEVGDIDQTCPTGVPGAADGREGIDATDATATNATVAAPRIVELYPNPTTHGNVGEYLVLETPPETRLENWTLTDGHTTASLPNETVSGRVAVSADPDATARLTAHSVLEFEGTLRLAADGDDLELRNETTTVDTVAYDRAPLAERWYRSNADDRKGTASSTPAAGVWHPRGATCLPVSSADVDEATAFVLPDAPEIPRETIRAADDRLLLAGYTFTSERIAADLVEAAGRGVDVAVLLESSPVGGTPQATEPVLETLEAGGVDVRVTGGEGARYRYHHPKYAVADDRVLVTSENWKPSGIGGASSRGWGVRLEDATLAADLATVFRTDYEGWDTESGATHRERTSFVDDEGVESASNALPTEHEPATVPLESAELLVAPDNAEERVIELLAAAEDEILVKQASIAADADVLEETIEAARRGVDVKILLDSTWYHEEQNDALADELKRIAADESLSLEVTLVEETDRFEKIHAKGVVIDRETAIVGSANWNENSFENNREVLLALHGEAVATYYADVFEADWSADGGSWRLPFGVTLTTLAALALAAFVGRRYVRFGDPE
ncbi:phospholipase D-like domain-containing protein [Natronorubrum halophilum]|uniref:phospholipase D-like domain-containing protein n=1 Tax=Natronorubrum halophilum TaxID=1702106 RepID=UPI000EF6980A|nr:phospholipase D-like domain-containing protein [Natronorubrum halophilum]